jgi:hypothetical protein
MKNKHPKRAMARKMLGKDEKGKDFLGRGVFDSKNWNERKNQIAERIYKRNAEIKYNKKKRNDTTRTV